MQVILMEKVANLGDLGAVVRVKDGYARNFLIPQRMARRATADAIAEFEARRAELEKAAAEKLAAAQAQGEKLAGLRVEISQKSGVDGRLFGSVTSADVVDAIVAQTSISLDRRKVTVDHIKATGTHSAAVKLHADVEFPITLEIVAK